MRTHSTASRPTAPRPTVFRVAASVLVALLGACQSSPISGPPKLRLGRHECAVCGMLVSEDRCSTAHLVDDRGRRDYLFYDDIGCMLDAEHEGRTPQVLERYVHDYTTRAWIRAEDATYVFANPKALPTPMGSGMVAFTTLADAQRTADPLSAKVLSFEQLVLARREYMDKHFGPSKAP